MADNAKDVLEKALNAIALMAAKAEKAKAKFPEGTSQHTLQKNRLHALKISSSLLSRELEESDVLDHYSKEDLEKALAPLASLISKSEKAQAKLIQGSWQHAMLGKNLEALHIASFLLSNALSEKSK